MRKSRFSCFFVEKPAFYSLHNAIYSIAFLFIWKTNSPTCSLFTKTQRLHEVCSDALYQILLYTKMSCQLHIDKHPKAH